jgi:hypothetical protein
MAITKIHPIKSTLNLAINYITSNDKTDEQILISSDGCSPSTAHLQFMNTREVNDTRGTVLARHLIQSFVPGEVSPEKAHEIGLALAKEVLNGEYEYVLATHVDRNHIHNHIIFNNVNLESDPVSKLAIYEVKIREGIKGVNIIDYSPKTFSVIFEKEESVSKKVEIAFIGDAPSEYTALEPIIKPANIDIWGGASSIDNIARVVVDVNYDNFSENVISYTAPVRILDDKGNELTNLKKSPQFVEVTLPIGKKKTVAVEPMFTGKLPDGYFHTNTIVNPKELTIVGKPEVIDTIKSIKLQPIALDNLIQTSTLKVDFKLPEGVKYIDVIDNKATVIVEIKKQDSFTYSIPIEEMEIEVVGLSEGLKYELATQQISLMLRATPPIAITSLISIPSFLKRSIIALEP